MRLIDADVLKQHIDKLPALPDGNFAGNHSALKALINMQPTFEPSTNCSEIPNGSDDTISRQDAIDAIFSEPLYESGMKKRDADAVVPAIYEKIKSLPSAEPKTPSNGSITSMNPENTHDRTMSDLISRQAAIDALRNRWLKTMNIGGLGEDIAEKCEICLRAVPSAQPEIIRCKDCKHWDGVDTCDVIDAPVWDKDFCSMAERRTDEE